jgi:hypothetical protein
MILIIFNKIYEFKSSLSCQTNNIPLQYFQANIIKAFDYNLYSLVLIQYVKILLLNKCTLLLKVLTNNICHLFDFLQSF